MKKLILSLVFVLPTTLALGQEVSRIKEFRISAAALQGKWATGLGFEYGWLISPRFLATIDSLYMYSDLSTYLGYGLKLSHRIASIANDDITCWLHYGLLMRLSWLADRSGSASSHDTELGVKTKFQDIPSKDQNFSLGFSYNISQLKFFEITPLSQNTVQFTFGFGF